MCLAMSNVHFASKKIRSDHVCHFRFLKKTKKTGQVLNPGPLAPKAGVITIRPANLLIENTTYLD